MKKHLLNISLLALTSAVSTTASANIWTNFATGNSNQNEIHAGYCGSNQKMTGLRVKEQAGYGVTDIMLLCGITSSQSYPTGTWILNNRAPASESEDNCLSNDLTGMRAVEQGGYGVIDIKLRCGDEAFPQYSTDNEGITLNPNGHTQSPISCPQNMSPVGMQVHEQYGYGVINFKILCR